jgi:CHAT domain-containing protein
MPAPLTGVVVLLATAGAAGDSPARQAALDLVRQARGQEAAAPRAALRTYEQALQAAVAADDRLLAAAIARATGAAHDAAGASQKALATYERGQDLLAGGPAEPPVEKSFQGRAGAPSAPDLFRAPAPDDLGAWLATPSARAELEVALAVDAGNLYLRQSQVAAARKLYGAALSRARAERFAPLEAGVLVNLAWVAVHDGRAADARELLESALRLPAAPDPRGSRRLRLLLGVQLREAGKTAEALAELGRARDLYAAAGDARGRAQVLCDLGLTRLAAGQVAEAAREYERALALNGDEVQDLQIQWQAEAGLARCLRRQGRLADALRHFDTYVATVMRIADGFRTDQGRVSLLDTHASFFDEFVDTALGVALETDRHAVVAEAIARVRDLALPVLQTARLSQRTPTAGRLPADRILPDAARRASMMEQSAPAVSLGTLDVALAAAPPPEVTPPPAVLLEYYVGPQRTAAVVHGPNGVAASAIALGADALEAAVREYRDSLRVDDARKAVVVGEPAGPPPAANTTPERARALARSLFDGLIGPVRAHLPRGVQPLVIVPHRALWNLPFAALESPEGRPLADDERLTYAPSPQSWRVTAGQRRLADHRSVRAWVVGDPAFPAEVEACGRRIGLGPLPGAAREARTIAALLGAARADVFVGAQADRLRLEAWHPEFSVLHLATHGVACPGDPLSSFVALAQVSPAQVELSADGREVRRRDDARRPVALDGPLGDLGTLGIPIPPLLDARTVVTFFNLRADLVTLSACQSGLGRVLGQGTIGFTRAFLAAGARSLLVSLWDVDDAATEALMTAFYEEYLRDGDKARALQRAMQRVRARFPDPRLWAAFTLVGMAE